MVRKKLTVTTTEGLENKSCLQKGNWAVGGVGVGLKKGSCPTEGARFWVG